jgi:hypothetical protein
LEQGPLGHCPQILPLHIQVNLSLAYLFRGDVNVRCSTWLESGRRPPLQPSYLVVFACLFFSLSSLVLQYALSDLW